MNQRIQKIEARMSEQDLQEQQLLEQQQQEESQYKLIQQINSIQKQYQNITIIISIIIGIITSLLQILNYQPQLFQIWITTQLILLLHYFFKIRKIDKKLNNQELSQTLQQLAGDKLFVIHLLKFVQYALSFFAYFKNVIIGISISQIIFVLIIN